MIYKNDLFALKRIPKVSVDKQKRIEHLRNEKYILNKLKKNGKKESLNYIVHLEETFCDMENINFLFEYLPG